MRLLPRRRRRADNFSPAVEVSMSPDTVETLAAMRAQLGGLDDRLSELQEMTRRTRQDTPE
jgi:hypothetical protein